MRKEMLAAMFVLSLVIVTITNGSQPLVWYKFDESSGGTAADSSGNGNDGTIGYATPDGQWVAGAPMAIENPGGRSFDFDIAAHNTGCRIPFGVFDNLDKEISIAVWAKCNRNYVAATPLETNPILYVVGGTELMIAPGYITMWWVPWRAGVHGNRDQTEWATSWDEWDNSVWNHWVFTKNADTGVMNIYKNGVLKHSDPGNFHVLKNATAVSTANIGYWAGYGNWNGEIDDFRLYDEELPVSVARRLAGLSDAKKAYWPIPGEAAPEIPFGEPVLLDWEAGEGAATHTLLMGTKPFDLSVVDSGLTESSYLHPGLDPATTYYWRIDEVNGVTTTGDVWSFDTAECLSVDDFEAYPDANSLESSWTASGDSINLETAVVNGGARSLRLDYENQNSPYYLEAERAFAAPQDWTASDIRALALWFRGEASNVSQPMYVKLVDAAGVPQTGTLTHPDSDATTTTDWTIWNIDLADPAFSSVDMTKIAKIIIGVGGAQTAQTAADKLYIDDIKLYPSRCLPESMSDVDFNGDCVVDIEDVYELTSEWLSCTTPGQAGCTPLGTFQVAELRNVVIDGDLSEWDEAIWYSFDKPLAGFWADKVPDITDIDYAVSWDSTNPTDVYVAVKVTDTSHFFNDEAHDWIWDIGDLLEVRLEASGVGQDATTWWPDQDEAQMYTISKKDSVAGAWVVWGTWDPAVGYYADDPTYDSEIDYAVVIDPTDADVIVYEVAMKAFLNYGGFSSTTNTYRTLAAGDTIRLDLQVDGISTMTPSKQNGAIFLKQDRNPQKPGTWYPFTLLGGVGCGGWGYLGVDVNEDCTVNLKDFGGIANEFMEDQLWP